ncbi:putative glycoside hydrolase [Vibrio sp. WXL103]|uniref:putative glycoside hydrolase n=1 Tax=Vibrio sp. WXL103 TaxID=3450710 RepID=UPI003EC5A9CC
MNFKYKTLALAVVSAVSLSGCFIDDPYDYTGGNGNDNGNALSWGVELYKERNDNHKASPYNIEIVDRTEDAQAFDGNLLQLDNVTIDTENFEAFTAITVAVSDDKATLQFVADEGYDMGITYNTSGTANMEKGTLQFDIKPSSLVAAPTDGTEPGAEDKIYLTMGSKNEYRIDITSAFNASKGADKAQSIKIPMKCFVDQGLDFRNVKTALALETNGAVQYEFSNAFLIANSLPDAWGTNNFLSCENLSAVQSGAETVLSRRYASDHETKVTHGWANGYRVNNGKTFTPSPGIWTQDELFAGINYVPCDGVINGSCYTPGQNSFLAFDVNLVDEDGSKPDYQRVDISRYMETGALEFALFFPNNGPAISLDSFDINFKFDASVGTGEATTNIPNSQDYSLTISDYDASVKVYRVSIPLKEMFTQNGTVQLNTLQRIDKLASFVTPTDSSVNYNFSNFSYAISDVSIVQQPTQDEDLVQIYPVVTESY